MRRQVTLDEAAYELLKAWKWDTRESFSSVVKRIVPKHGTLGAFISLQGIYACGDERKDDLMEIAVCERPLAKTDPWS